MDQSFHEKLLEVIEANIGNPDFGAKILAREIGMSYTNLLRKVKSHSGKSINQLIRDTRLTKALEILQTEDVSITEVSYRLGFSSPAYFTTCFKKRFGYSPGDIKPKQNAKPPLETQNFASLDRNPQKSRKISPSRIIRITGAPEIIILYTMQVLIRIRNIPQVHIFQIIQF